MVESILALGSLIGVLILGGGPGSRSLVNVNPSIRVNSGYSFNKLALYSGLIFASIIVFASCKRIPPETKETTENSTINSTIVYVEDVRFNSAKIRASTSLRIKPLTLDLETTLEKMGDTSDRMRDNLRSLLQTAVIIHNNNPKLGITRLSQLYVKKLAELTEEKSTITGTSIPIVESEIVKIQKQSINILLEMQDVLKTRKAEISDLYRKVTIELESMMNSEGFKLIDTEYFDLYSTKIPLKQQNLMASKLTLVELNERDHQMIAMRNEAKQITLALPYITQLITDSHQYSRLTKWFIALVTENPIEMETLTTTELNQFNHIHVEL